MKPPRCHARNYGRPLANNPSSHAVSVEKYLVSEDVYLSFALYFGTGCPPNES